LLDFFAVITRIVLICAISTMSFRLQAQSELLYGASVYVAHPEDLGGFLTAEIEKRKLHVVLSPDPALANYILAGGVESAAPATEVRSSHSGSTATCRSTLVLVDRRNRSVVWTTDAEVTCPGGSPDRARRLAAEKLIRQFQKDLFVKRSLTDRVDAILAP
jgi:hypothetical protein